MTLGFFRHSRSSIFSQSDLTVNGDAYVNLTVSRTGSPLTVSRLGGSTVSLGSNVPVYEDLNDGYGGGVWSIPSYTTTPFEGSNVPAFTSGSSTSAAIMTATDPSLIINGGDFDISVEIMHGWSTLQSGNVSTGLFYTLFHGNSPDGDIRLRFSWTAQSYILTIKGADILTIDATLHGQSQNWIRGDYFKVRAWYRPSTGECGIQTSNNGAYCKRTLTSTSGGALSACTSWYWGSYNGTSDFASGRFTLMQIHSKADLPTQPNCEILDIGDSITGPYLYRTATSTHLYTIAERRVRAGIMVQAIPGDTVSGQSTVLTNGEWNTLSSIRAVIIDVGANSIVANISGATLISQWQTLVNNAKTKYPTAKIIGCKMSPMFKRFDDLGSSSMKTAYTTLNTAIGDGTITGLDAVESTSRTSLGGQGGDPNYLQLQYDQFPTGGTGGTQEGLHPNDAGQHIRASARRAVLQSLGILP